MRVRVLGQFAKGVTHHDKTAGARLAKEIESIKWTLWNGSSGLKTSRTISPRSTGGIQNHRKFVTAAREFGVYIANNVASLINYGERYRSGERISSAFAEATVNAVVSKRFAKKQQMQWTRRGAHLLLQTRTRTLDGTLRSTFERWYPGLANKPAPGNNQLAA